MVPHAFAGAQVCSTIQLAKHINTIAFLTDDVILAGCEEDTNVRVCSVKDRCDCRDTHTGVSRLTHARVVTAARKCLRSQLNTRRVSVVSRAGRRLMAPSQSSSLRRRRVSSSYVVGASDSVSWLAPDQYHADFCRCGVPQTCSALPTSTHRRFLWHASTHAAVASLR